MFWQISLEKDIGMVLLTIHMTSLTTHFIDLEGGFGRQTGSDSARLKWLDMSCTHKSVDLSIWNLELSGIKS